MVELCLFILVSKPFKCLTGEIEGVLWWTFRYLSQLTHIKTFPFVVRIKLIEYLSLTKSFDCTSVHIY